MKQVFIYVDIDAFFAAVECIENPSLQGKPVIIGASDPKRGVVSTASYEARKYGVHSAMSSVEAHRLCPNGIFLKPNMKLYASYSKRICNILKEFSPIVHMISVDEGYLDMTGMGRLYKSTREAALTIKKKIFAETNLTASLGVANNLILAKMASDYKKPNALCVVKEGREEEFIDTVGLSKLWGVGKQTREKLQKNGIMTTFDLRSYDRDSLIRKFGKASGNYLYDVVRGKAQKTVKNDIKTHSISRENTFYNSTKDMNEITSLLNYISFDLLIRSMDENIIGHSITLKIRYDSFETFTVSKRNESGYINSTLIFEDALSLFEKAYTKWRKIRLLGLSLSQFSKKDDISFSLFEDENTKDIEKHRILEEKVRPLLKKGLSISKGFYKNKCDS